MPIHDGTIRRSGPSFLCQGHATVAENETPSPDDPVGALSFLFQGRARVTKNETPKSPKHRNTKHTPKSRNQPGESCDPGQPYIETHRICVHMFPRSVPTRSRCTDSVGPGFGLVIGTTWDSHLKVECCASNHIHVSSQCPNTFPEIRELLRQMGSGLVVTK